MTLWGSSGHGVPQSATSPSHRALCDIHPTALRVYWQVYIVAI